jgi:flavin reductase (DIM6/NTAB) family NADH-FMN oxidoreductase RutF
VDVQDGTSGATPSDAAPAIDPKLFRRVMGAFASGVTVVTTVAEGDQGGQVGGHVRDQVRRQVRGMTVSAFMSGSLDPPLCVISIRKAARMHPLLLATGHFGVSILARSQERVSGHFAGQPLDGFTPELIWAGPTPMLANATAVIAADVATQHDCGDHTLLIGHIRYMAAHGLPPLLVHEGRYAGLAYGPESGHDWVVDIW